MLVKVVLCDINPKMIAAWKDSFEENPEVDVVQGSILDQQTTAYVTPTNAKASMDGGLDGVLKKKFGQQLQTKIQAEVKKLYNGHMKVGQATCVESGADQPKYIISTPTMAGASDDISNSLNVALTCCAAFQMVHMHNSSGTGTAIRSVTLPGLGTGTGRMPVEIAADLMWTAYNLFREKEFKDFDEMKKALEEILGDLGEFGDNMKGSTGHAKIAAATAAINAPAPAALPDDDADDFDDADDGDGDGDGDDEDDFDDH